MGSVYSSLCFSAVPRENSGSFSSPLNPEQGHIPQTLRCWQSRGQVKSQSCWQSLVEGPAPGCHPLGLLTSSSTSPSISDVGLLYNGSLEQRELSLPCWTFCAIGSVHYSSTAKRYPTFLQPQQCTWLYIFYHFCCWSTMINVYRHLDSVLDVLPVKTEIVTFRQTKKVKYVSSLKRGFTNLAFTSTLHKCNWHKTEGSALLEMVLQMAVFQQTTY